MLLAAGLQPPFNVPVGAWSLFANVLSYVLIAALFGIEFAVRGRRFPNQPYRGFLDFARRLAALGHMFRPIAGGTGSFGKRTSHD